MKGKKKSEPEPELEQCQNGRFRNTGYMNEVSSVPDRRFVTFGLH
jgi:hypothetical protein